ncbi:hypothetical protein Asi02nite_23480 [Asanoa siamensis]|uniref:Uncharacterized protein n=1 Tax=Asanoa siamensis TaxID=926357 RepID=A0ABQ4CNF7_9ACTN|nr:hypothetical protein Asi02nite_23480 [Asanoa siamensis]
MEALVRQNERDLPDRHPSRPSTVAQLTLAESCIEQSGPVVASAQLAEALAPHTHENGPPGNP